MRIKHTRENDVAVIHIEGKFWGESDGEAFSSVIQNLMDESCYNVVVDIEQVTLMNSSGLGSIIANLKALRDLGGDLRLAHVHDRIHNLLRITKLIQVVKIYDTREDAVRSFHGKDEG